MSESQPKMSEVSQNFWDYVQHMNEVSGRLLQAKDNLEDPSEEDMRIMFDAQFQDFVPKNERKENFIPCECGCGNSYLNGGSHD